MFVVQIRKPLKIKLSDLLNLISIFCVFRNIGDSMSLIYYIR